MSAKLLDRLFSADDRGWRGLPIRVLRIAYLGYREFIKDFCWERAASLTFTTIISLLPIGVLVLNIFSLFVKDNEDFKQWVRDRVDSVVLLAEPPETREPEHDGRDNAENPPPEPSQPEQRSAIVEEGENANAAAADPEEAWDPSDVRVVLNSWIESSFDSEIFNVGVSENLAAFAILVFSALALLVSAERVFNRIWKVHGTRTYFQKFVAFWMILTTSPLLVAAVFFVDGMTGEGTTFHGLLEDLHLIFLYSFLIPTFISCAAFTFMNLFLPRTRVRFLAALIGGCFAGVLWVVLKDNFYLYFRRALEMRSFYGSLAIVPIFLFFVYLTWLIILAGGELSYTAQHYRHLVHAHKLRQKAVRYSTTFVGLRVLERVLRPYRRGEAVPTIDDLVDDELDLQPEECESVIQALKDLDVLTEAPNGDTRRFLPARDPRAVPLGELVRQLLAMGAREHQDEAPGVDAGDTDTSPPGVSGELFDQAREAYLKTFDDLTLDDLSRDRLGYQATDAPEAEDENAVATQTS